MPEFEDARAQFRQARAASEELYTELIRSRETAKRKRRAARLLERKANQGSGEEIANQLSAALEEANAADARAERAAASLQNVLGSRARAAELFAQFTDPRTSVSRLSDRVPVALFPLRLETRYRKTNTQNGEEVQLWVRVYPDDILVDSFQPEISETELKNVTIYWTHKWRGGGDRATHRAAWAQLVRSHGSGRARWLIEQVPVKNPGEEPSAGETDHVLVILPKAPVPQHEKAPIRAFWARVWSSGGAERDAAFNDLLGALGPTRAAEVESELEPENLLDTAVRPSDALTPMVVFLDLPSPDTLPMSLDPWSRAAHTWLLPERLVLLGFRADSQVLFELGNPIPPDLQVGPDPSAGEDDQLRSEGANLQIPSGMKWTVDFDDALEKGMAFSVNLTERGIDPNFDRLFVLGVRVGSTPEEGAQELTQLLHNHHRSRQGCALLPQGRPTNNTEGQSAGFRWWENPDETFEHYFEPDTGDDPTEWQRRKDGAWLAGLLGLDRDAMRPLPHYHGSDQAEARAMNIALWPATAGYYLQQMLEPVFEPATGSQIRSFFTRFVSGRGTLPLLRIGKQPYGILPATVWSETDWWNDDGYAKIGTQLGLPSPRFLDQLYGVIQRVRPVWRNLAARVSHVGGPTEDPHQALLDILGLHPTSAEFYQRLSQSFTQYYNLLGLEGDLVSDPFTGPMRRYVEAGLLALSELGWVTESGDGLPPLVQKVFLETPNLLGGPLVQAELSESSLLGVNRTDGRNYIDWLQWAAGQSHDLLRKQEGFPDGLPNALLYLWLHHALDLGYVETALDLAVDAHRMDGKAHLAARREPEFMYIAEQGGGESLWARLYQVDSKVTGSDSQLLGHFIPTILASKRPYLSSQLDALGVLKTASTAALERAFVEHVDCLSYRLDAWLMSLEAAHLAYLRGETSEGFSEGGIHLGAFGWVENLSPSDSSLSEADLDAAQAKLFDEPGASPLMENPDNLGHIHAPSLDHAVTAAILRNGHHENRTSEAPDLLAVDLSSRRVRLALQIIEGIRNGQALGALLGYRLERGLHDEPKLFLDRLIYELRRKFPIAGDRNQSTPAPEGTPITALEARNVIDGEAFANHIAKNKVETYPYGLTGLPSLNDLTTVEFSNATELGRLIDRHVAEMRSVGDAVADLAVAEGVYQVVRGNYDRAAGTLDAFSKGGFPPVPEVASTPRSGRTLTHRIGLHLRGGMPATGSVPRAKAEPALAEWLSEKLPAPSTVVARISWRDVASGTDVTLTPSMADLGLAAVDLFYLLDAGGARDMPGFDDLLIDFAERHSSPPAHDALFRLEYKPEGAGLTLFEVAPLVRALRGFILGARPLQASDIALANEASKADDADMLVRPDKVQAVLGDFQGTFGAVDGFVSTLEGAVGESVDPIVAQDNARDHIDTWIVSFAAALRPIRPFGLQAGSLTRAVEGRRTRLGALLKDIDEVIERWRKKQNDYDTVLTGLSALSDEDKIPVLIRAGRIVSTSVITPIPSASALTTAVSGLRGTFDTELSNLEALRSGARRVGATLSAWTAFLPTYEAIDQTPLSLDAHRQSVLAFARELLEQARLVREDLEQRSAFASAALVKASGTSGEPAQQAITEAVQAIVGGSFIVLPEFRLSEERLAEWDNVWNTRAALLDHLRTGTLATPFPVDDWLQGVALVRERPRNIELSRVLGDAFAVGSTLSLEALQFPHRPGIGWVGLHFPETFPDGTPFELGEDKLLYSASLGSGAAIDSTTPSRTYSGLLLDEWVEVVPVERETTGLSFHFDRPNTEAPQAILLATPPTHKSGWQWQHLVDTLHETLDLARQRAVEPAHLDKTALAPLIPAVMAAVAGQKVTSMLDLMMNNEITKVLKEIGDE